MKYYIYILFFALAFLFACKEKISAPCPKEFVIYGEVNPYTDTYKVGDTLLLQVANNYMIFERNTKQYYNLSNINIEVGLTVYRIDSLDEGYYHHVTDYVNVVSNPEYNNYIQDFSNGNSILFSNILIDGDTFRNEIKITLKKKGIFMLSYGAFTNECNQEFLGKCSNINFQLTTRLNPDFDNNISLLQETQNEYFNTWMVEDNNRFYYQKMGFAYKVID